jgi:hypothetical protein
MSSKVISMETAGRAPGRQPGARTRERLLFEALVAEGRKYVRGRALIEALEQAGLRLDDPRLAETVKALQDRAVSQEQPRRLEYDEFVDVIRPSILTVERALRQDLVIPDFPGFSRELARIYDQTTQNQSGDVADYIPQLGRVDPDQYGVGVCTIDGQRTTLGDARRAFCLQSSVKPVLYAMALEEHGEAVVHEHIGCEPSGQTFNELALNPAGLPHNPMINAGAIMSTSLIRPGEAMADRFDHVLACSRRRRERRLPMSETTMVAPESGAFKTDRSDSTRVYQTEQDLTRLINRFESCTLPRVEWTHEAHLAVAAWYLSRYPQGLATVHMIDCIKRYNRASGSYGYHETITRFWLVAIRRHLETCPGGSLVERVNDVVATFADRRDLMFDYYSRDRILSEEARREWLEPDLRPLAV